MKSQNYFGLPPEKSQIINHITASKEKYKNTYRPAYIM